MVPGAIWRCKAGGRRETNSRPADGTAALPRRLKSDRNPRGQRAGLLVRGRPAPPACAGARSPSWERAIALSWSIDLEAWILRRTGGSCLPRKEVIQPHLPVRLPCYDFVPVTSPTFGGSALAVRSPTSGVANSHDVTGGVYKARERIQCRMADRHLLATPTSCRRVAACNLN